MADEADSRAELARLHAELEAAKKRLAGACKRAARMPVRDYTFQSRGGSIRLSELLGAKDDLVVVHNMGRSCVYCTMWADGLSGLAPHLSDRAAFVLSSPDPVEVQSAFADSRGWRFPVVSTRGTTFAADMGFESGGRPMPGYSVFRRQSDGSLARTGASHFGPGDDYCAIWPMMEQMERGVDGWKPKFEY